MEAVEPTSPRGRPRDPSRDAAILDAALSLLEEVGYDRTTVDAIAERARVGKATIYRRWPEGKAPLVIDAVLKRRPDVAPPDTGTLRGDLLALVQGSAVLMGASARLVGGLTSRLQDDAAFAALVREHLIGRERAKWRVVAERAVARGELHGVPTRLFDDLAPSLLHGRIAFTGEPVDDAFAVELVDRVLLPVLHATPLP